MESFNIHDITLALIGTLPNELGWVYGICDIFIVTIIITCIILIFLLPFKLMSK